MPHQDDDTGINGDVDQYSSFLLESEMNFDEGEYALFPIESMSNTPGHDSTEYFTSMSSSNSDSNQDSTSSRRTSLQDQSELAFPSYNINNQCKVMGSDDEVLSEFTC